MKGVNKSNEKRARGGPRRIWLNTESDGSQKNRRNDLTMEYAVDEETDGYAALKTGKKRR